MNLLHEIKSIADVALFIHGLRWFIASIGILIISTSAAKALIQYILYFLGITKDSFNLIRLDFGHAIILGLEFLVGADVIESIIKPDYYDIGILAILVLIRTFLSYFLNKELQSLPLEQRGKLR